MVSQNYISRTQFIQLGSKISRRISSFLTIYSLGRRQDWKRVLALEGSLNHAIWQAIRSIREKIRLILKKTTAGDDSCGRSNRPLVAVFVQQKLILEGQAWLEECSVNPALRLGLRFQSPPGGEAIMG